MDDLNILRYLLLIKKRFNPSLPNSKELDKMDEGRLRFLVNAVFPNGITERMNRIREAFYGEELCVNYLASLGTNFRYLPPIYRLKCRLSYDIIVEDLKCNICTCIANGKKIFYNRGIRKKATHAIFVVPGTNPFVSKPYLIKDLILDWPIFILPKRKIKLNYKYISDAEPFETWRKSLRDLTPDSVELGNTHRAVEIAEFNFDPEQ
jgi:hypothetical protein